LLTVKIYLKRVLLGLALIPGWTLFALNPAKAQDSEAEYQLWLNYSLNIPAPVHKKWTLGGDAGIRGLLSNQDWTQILVRPTVKYKFNPVFSFAGGFATFLAFDETIDNTFEFRLFQDGNMKWPDFGPVFMIHRVRIEQRFFFYASDTLQNDSYVRPRYLAGLETINFKLFGSQPNWYLQTLWEFFGAWDDASVERFVNNQRLHAALGHRISDLMRWEIHYIRQKSREFDDDGFQTSHNIFRFRFYHTINRDKGESVE